ncbi:hypothetical protein [Actinoallomurus sp. CA-142502]|uniref:hypothetical protein n=1 Tax=Actinoallomurus sp. CA-142502 TaxID=3239885 RepID=UPI003D8EF68A
MMQRRRSWWAAGLLVLGIALLLSTALIEALSPDSVGASVLLGTFGVICLVVVVGTPLRRRRAGSAATGGRLIASALVLTLLCGVLYTLPPHSVVFAALLLIVAAGFFTIGVAIVGGGYFGLVGAVGAGLICAAVMMAPTPIALATMDHTVTCEIPAQRYAGTSDDFDVHCPGGKVYPIRSRQPHATGVPVRMLIDPHGLLRPEIADRVHVHKDELALLLSLLLGAATVVAAYVNRRRGRVRPVVSPRPGSGG